MSFDHEKMDVYQLALAFATVADSTVQNLPRGRRVIADQLMRASLSIVLNIAEGTGKLYAVECAVAVTTNEGCRMQKIAGAPR